jgi:ATP-binding cassette subfamily A (ABC1) protein 3
MNIMGMKLSTYYFTWFMRYFITLAVIHGIGCYIVGRTLVYVGYIIPLVIFLLFDIVLIIQSFFIQTFFSRAKIGVVIALLFFLVQYIISFISTNSDNPTLKVNLYNSIVPHVAFLLCFRTMFYAESMQIKLTFTDTLNNYNLMACIISCIGNAIFWLILTWYF